MIEIFSLFSLLIVIYDYFFEIKSRNRVFFILLISLIFFESTKWNQGVDWLPYFNFFQASKEISIVTILSTQIFEPGFVLLNYVIRNITENYTFFLSIVMILLYVPLFTSVFFITNKSFLSIFYLITTIPWYSGSLRQMIAIGFFALAINMILKRRFLWFLFFMFVGSMFHTSLLPMILTFFLYGISWNLFILLFLILFGIGLFADKLISLLDYFLSQLGRRSDYSSKVGANVYANPILGLARKIYYLFGFYIFYYSASFHFINLVSSEVKKLNFFIMLSSLTIWAYVVGTYKVIYFNSRMDIYFSIIAGAYLIGVIEYLIKSKLNKFLLIVFVVSLSSIFYSRLEFMNLFHPYSSIFYNTDYERNFEVCPRFEECG
tara:strand:- start:10021 stop:11151 length:1131 start_codon:yes stop_codon:yes gene_type:complete